MSAQQVCRFFLPYSVQNYAHGGWVFSRLWKNVNHMYQAGEVDCANVITADGVENLVDHSHGWNCSVAVADELRKDGDERVLPLLLSMISIAMTPWAVS